MRISLLVAAASAATAVAGSFGASNATHLRSGNGRRLQGTAVSIPGSISAKDYYEYINTVGDASPVSGSNIVGIKRGEQASYTIIVAKAGTYAVTYRFGSSSPTSIDVALVSGRNCFDNHLGRLYRGTYSTKGGQLEGTTSTSRFHLNAGTQTITVCFAKAKGATFGGMGLALSDGSLPAPPVAPTYPAAGANSCYKGAVWESKAGAVRLNGKPLHLKGVNWFGFDTRVFNLNGLWATTVPQLLDTLKGIDINLLRLPLSLNLTLNPLQEAYACGSDDASCPIKDPATKTRLAWDQLEYAIDQAALRGMLVILDMHNLDPSGNHDNALWYNDQYSEATFIAGWSNVLARFKSKPNLLGIDIYNEPHAQASWGLGITATDFGLAAARIIEAIDKKHSDYKGLFLVEGVQLHAITPFPSSQLSNHWWGGNLDGLFDFPVSFAGASNAADLNARLVYSPHVYGPSIFAQSYFDASNFPENMPGIWNRQLGFIERVTNGKAVVIGEWGGQYTGKDKVLQDKLSSYLASKCMSDAIWWAVNPNAGTTGGLFTDDWVTLNNDKVALLTKTQPTPTRFTSAIKSGQFCVDFGANPNPACIVAASYMYDLP